MKYRRKPILVDAIQWTGNNCSEVQEFTKAKIITTKRYIGQPEGFLIEIDSIHEHNLCGIQGDYIIRNEYGEFGCREHDTFEKFYEAVNDNEISE